MSRSVRLPRQAAAVLLVALLPAALRAQAPADSAPLPPTGATAALFERLAPAVLRIELLETRSQAKVSVGSGFFATPDGRVVTNYHVVSRLVQEPSRHVARAMIGGQPRDLALLAIDVVHDLAVLASGAAPPLVLEAAGRPVPKGTRLLALGHPRDLGLSVIEGTHNGYVEDAAVPLLHFTGPINPGMSGGPAVDEGGRVVGVNVATMGEEVAFLVPGEAVTALLARAPAAPPATARLRTDAGTQLAAAARRALAGLFGPATERVTLDRFRLPTRPDSTFRCWGDLDRDDARRYEVARHQCSTSTSIHLSETLTAGVVQVAHAVVDADSLSRLAALTALEQQFSYSSDYDGTARETTRFRCTQANVRTADFTWRTALCARRLRHLPGLYEGMFRAVTLGEGRRGLVTSLLLSGVPFELFRELAPRYLALVGRAE